MTSTPGLAVLLYWMRSKHHFVDPDDLSLPILNWYIRQLELSIKNCKHHTRHRNRMIQHLRLLQLEYYNRYDEQCHDYRV